MALLPWLTGKIIRIEDETALTKRYWISVPELASFDFKPGQFVTLDLPIDEKPNKRLRSYSIASAPDGSNVLELVIVRDKQGVGTKYIFETLQIGSEVKFRGPQGMFALKTPLDLPVFFICTGTGIAPFRSMLQFIRTEKLAHKELYLIFGCRTSDNLLYRKEMTELEASMPGFHYIPTLSREEWEGHTGYVHEVYESLCANKQPAVFYLCGWRGMIDEATQRIEAMGYEKKFIHTEIYG